MMKMMKSRIVNVFVVAVFVAVSLLFETSYAQLRGGILPPAPVIPAPIPAARETGVDGVTPPRVTPPPFLPPPPPPPTVAPTPVTLPPSPVAPAVLPPPLPLPRQRQAAAEPVTTRGHPYAGCPTMKSWSTECAGKRWRQIVGGSYLDDLDDFAMTVSDGLYTCCHASNLVDGACTAGTELDQGYNLFSCKISVDYCDTLTVTSLRPGSNEEGESACNNANFSMTGYNTYVSQSDATVTLELSTGPNDIMILTCLKDGVMLGRVEEHICENDELPVQDLGIGQQEILNARGDGNKSLYVIGASSTAKRFNVAQDLVTFELSVPPTGLEVYVVSPMVLDTAFVSVLDNGDEISFPVVQFMGDANHFMITPTGRLEGVECTANPNNITVQVMMVASGTYSRDGEFGQVGIRAATVPNSATNFVETVTFEELSDASCIAQIIGQSAASDPPISMRISNLSSSDTTSADFTLWSLGEMNVGDVVTFAYFCVGGGSSRQTHLFPGAYIQGVSYNLGAEGVAVTDDVTGTQPVFPAVPQSVVGDSDRTYKGVFVTPENISDSADLILTYDGTATNWSVYPRHSTCATSDQYNGSTAKGFEVIIFDAYHDEELNFSGVNSPLKTPYGGCPVLNYFGTTYTTGEYTRVSDRVWSNAKNVNGAEVPATTYFFQSRTSNSGLSACASTNWDGEAFSCRAVPASVDASIVTCKVESAYCPVLYILSGQCFGKHDQTGTMVWGSSGVSVSGYTDLSSPIFTCSKDSATVTNYYCSNGYLPARQFVEGYNVLSYGVELVAAETVTDRNDIRGFKAVWPDMTKEYRLWVLAASNPHKDPSFYFTAGNQFDGPSHGYLDSIDTDSVMMGVSSCVDLSAEDQEDYYVVQVHDRNAKGSIEGVDFVTVTKALTAQTIAGVQEFPFDFTFKAAPTCLFNAFLRTTQPAAYQEAIIDSVTATSLKGWYAGGQLPYTVSLFCIETTQVLGGANAVFQLAVASVPGGYASTISGTSDFGGEVIPMGNAIVAQSDGLLGLWNPIVEGSSLTQNSAGTGYTGTSFSSRDYCDARITRPRLQSAMVLVDTASSGTISSTSTVATTPGSSGGLSTGAWVGIGLGSAGIVGITAGIGYWLAIR